MTHLLWRFHREDAKSAKDSRILGVLTALRCAHEVPEAQRSGSAAHVLRLRD
jgi:hypothetical protein